MAWLTEPLAAARFLVLAFDHHGNNFVDGYNHHHRHTGIGLHTPADVHYGHATVTRAEREATLAAAREQHPERFTTNRSPKIINLPDTAWINQPVKETAA